MQVLGEKKVALKLDRAALAACSGPNLERALVAGALLPLNVAKRTCPWRTGNLRRSLHIGGHAGESGGLSGTTGTDVGGNGHTAAGAVILVGTNVEYGPYVEYGTSRMAPQPYMRPAFDGAGPVISAEMARAIHLMLAAAL